MPRPEKFYETMANMEAGFLMYVQDQNTCASTGKPCRAVQKCGCYLEMQAWCEQAQAVLKEKPAEGCP